MSRDIDLVSLIMVIVGLGFVICLSWVLRGSLLASYFRLSHLCLLRELRVSFV